MKGAAGRPGSAGRATYLRCRGISIATLLGVAGMANETSHLRYLSADGIRGPLPRFSNVDVRSESGTIGRLDGIIIDPPAKRMRYLVVDIADHGDHHRYLVRPSATRVDISHRALEIDLDKAGVEHCPEFDAPKFPRYSPDDLLAALFPHDAEAA
jgi:hypothetical protein